MTEEQLIAHDLVHWYKVFAVCFIVWAVLFCTFGAVFINEVHNINRCQTVNGDYSNGVCTAYGFKIRY